LTKRSTTSSPPKPWVFFTDRDLGNAIPDALKAAGFSVERHDDHFNPNTLDEEWLPAIAAKGWVAFSKNKKIQKVGYERDAAMRSGLALFFLIGRMVHADHATNLVATMGRVIHFRNKYDAPFMARIYRPDSKFAIGSRPGTVDMALTKQQWESGVAVDEK
jgi:hypothetical protein